MKLLQLNAWSNRLNKKVVELINTENPDIICLQEMFSSDKNLGFLVPLEELLKTIDYPYYYFSPVFSMKLMHDLSDFGNVIISRFPIEKASTVFTHLEYKADLDVNKHDYNVRNFQHASLKVDGKTLHVINHHGYHVPAHKDGNEITMSAARQINEYINQLTGPVILAGDFNLTPESKSMQAIGQGLRDLGTEYGLTSTRNDLTHKSEVCDYILVNDAVKVLNFSMSDIVASDHNGLIVEFEI